MRAQGTLPARALKKIEDEVLARSMRVLGTWAIGDLQDDCKKLTHIFNAVQSAAGLVNLQIAQEKPITNYNVKHGTIRNALANESGAVAAGEMNT